MSNINAIKLPFHRLHLLEFWRPKSAARLHKANSLIAAVIMRKLWKEGLKPGEAVPSFIEDDANDAMNQIREAIEGNDDHLLEDIFETVRETRELLETGLRQDHKRRIILAYSQLYYEKNTSPRPLVWVEAPIRPQGITLAPRGYWCRENVEPTEKQLWLRICENGERIPKSTYTHYLKKIGLNDLKEDPSGRPTRKSKLVSKRFL